jgi:hypothetical protein
MYKLHGLFNLSVSKRLYFLWSERCNKGEAAAFCLENGCFYGIVFKHIVFIYLLQLLLHPRRYNTTPFPPCRPDSGILQSVYTLDGRP